MSVPVEVQGSGSAASSPLSGTSLEDDAAAWDTFVAASPAASYLQATPWARVKRPNGWRAVRVVASGGQGAVGAQVLVRSAPGLPWAIGYAPRGPVSARELGQEALESFTAELRGRGRSLGASYVRVDPEVEEGGPLPVWLERNGWRRAPDIQPPVSRLLDLTRSEPELWDDLHRKCRQSINKAWRAGLRVVEANGERLSDFYRIHADASARAGIIPRAERTFVDLWSAFAPHGRARLFFAETGGGEAVATLLLVGWGRRIVDLYGGTTREGGQSRANYVLKWEAILAARAAGYEIYDLWGMPHAGIAQFKAGFGGREVRYIGAWDLVLDPLGHAALQAGVRVRSALVRWRRGDRGTDDGAGAEGDA